MPTSTPQIFLARHGETAWTITGQHTGLTDLPLTPRGEQNARQIGARLSKHAFSHVFTSPLQRAKRTCEIAGYPAVVVDPDLVEWNYGRYEGLTSAEIRKDRPDWDLFRDGCPDGESIDAIVARADRVISRLKAVTDDVLIFSSGHFSRVFAARWIGFGIEVGRGLLLAPASLSILSYDRLRTQPAICLWNDQSHLSE